MARSEQSPRVVVRLRQTLLDAVDEKAAKAGLTRSQYIQRVLATAVGKPSLGEPMAEGAAAFDEATRRKASKAGVKARRKKPRP